MHLYCSNFSVNLHESELIFPVSALMGSSIYTVCYFCNCHTAATIHLQNKQKSQQNVALSKLTFHNICSRMPRGNKSSYCLADKDRHQKAVQAAPPDSSVIREKQVAKFKYTDILHLSFPKY